jgi:hypothetical protein
LPSTSKLIRLKAFPMMHEQHTRSYRIWTHAELSPSELRIRFKLEAASANEFAKIILPKKNPQPVRQNEIWKETCFECFIPSAHSDAYLEFNGSPSGNWNWYSFRGYREGMKEFVVPAESQPRQTALSLSDQQIECEWTLPMVGLRLGFLSAGDSQFEFNRIGIASVLNTSIATTYWALSHEGIKPDFHLSSSFNFSLS